jgi:hypothetical protein
MNELQELYGVIGLGAITLFLPYLLQVVKMLTEWSEKPMLLTSLISTYVLVDLYVLGSILKDPPPTANWGDVVFFVLGGLIYPLFVWFGTQGIYSLFIRPSSKEQVAKEIPV